MKKNDYIDGLCIDYTHDAQGIVKIDGFPIFVKGMLLNEKGKVKIVKVVKNYAVGRLIEIYDESQYRNVPKCPLFKQCGGCHIQHLSNIGQQDFKTKRVRDTLIRIGHCNVEVLPCLMMSEPWYYRNKVQVPVGTIDNHIVTGFYKQHSNDIIPMEKCYIQNNESNLLVNRLKQLLEEANEVSFDKIKYTGNIRHILVKYASSTNQLMLVIITYKNKLKSSHYIVDTLIEEFKNLKTVVQNVNTRHDNVILGKENNILFGEGYIEDVLLENIYRISVPSFYQVNPTQVKYLYQTAIEFAEFNKDDIVIDAYCGIGTIALSLAKYVKLVYGVEVVEQAIIDAKENAIRNQIDNVDFVCKDAGEFMIDFANENKRVDVVIVDPPRKGCSQLFLDQLITLSPKKIIYISCDVATQARDIAYLQIHGFTADMCQPVDMFPQTHNIENVVRLVIR